jgi:uncharacterized protein (TIGR03437 family)
MKCVPAILLTPAFIAANLFGASVPGQYFTGQGARLIIGQSTFTEAMPGASNRMLGAVGGVAWANDTLYVADSCRFTYTTPQNRRVVMYRQVSQKLPDPTQPFEQDISRCPVCTGRADYPFTFDTVLGQTTFDVADPTPVITQSGMRLPTAVASDGRILAVADTENNRVLIWNSIPGSNGAPADIVLGQTGFDAIQQPIVVTASSFRGPQGVWIQDGRLYVADTQNHRILVWRSIPTKNNQAADFVLGQSNFTAAPEPDLTRLTTSASASALLNPVSVTSDGKHLFVTDLGFQRVLIWNSLPNANQAPADVVIGEPDMTTFNEGGNHVTKMCASTGTDTSGNLLYPEMCAGTLSYPRFTLTDGQRLYIADGGNDRVLIFNSIPTANGAAADVVLGQKNMTTNQVTDNSDLFTPNLQRSSSDTIRTPTSLAWDGQNLYVADPFDRRVLVFTPQAANVPMAGVRNAASLKVSAVGTLDFTALPAENDQITLTIAYGDVTHDYVYKALKDDKIPNVIAGLVKVINTDAGDPYLFAIANIPFNQIVLTAKTPGSDGNSVTLTVTLSTNATLAATATNPTGGGDAAKIAPGTIVSIIGENLADSSVSAPANSANLPRDLGGVQVYFDGIRSPLLSVSPTEIIAQMPYEVVDATSVTSWVRTAHGNGAVTVTTAVGVPVALQNPGIFAQTGDDPRVAIAYHYSNSATMSILVDGTIQGGDTATIVVEDRSYTYTVQGTDTLYSVRDALITMINTNTEEKVRAEVGGSFSRIILRAKAPGSSGDGLPVTTSTSTGAVLTVSASGAALCCGNVAGSLVTPENPALPGEMIYVYATGVGLISPEVAKEGLRTGQPYNGPLVNDPSSFMSSLAGGRTANVISAGAEPGTIGLHKVILELNSSLPTNPVTKLTIAQDIYVSNIVTIPVVQPNPSAAN